MAGVKGRSGRKANEQVFRHILIEKLNKLDKTTDRPRIHNIANALLNAAEDGDMMAIREVMDRVDGKPKQISEVSGPEGGEIPMGLTIAFKTTDD